MYGSSGSGSDSSIVEASAGTETQNDGLAFVERTRSQYGQAVSEERIPASALYDQFNGTVINEGDDGSLYPTAGASSRETGKLNRPYLEITASRANPQDQNMVLHGEFSGTEGTDTSFVGKFGNGLRIAQDAFSQIDIGSAWPEYGTGLKPVVSAVGEMISGVGDMASKALWAVSPLSDWETVGRIADGTYLQTEIARAQGLSPFNVAGKLQSGVESFVSDLTSGDETRVNYRLTQGALTAGPLLAGSIARAVGIEGALGEGVVANTASRLDYSARFADDLVNFNAGYGHFSGALENDMLLVQFHRSDRLLGQGRSAAWWTTPDAANPLLTENAVRESFALPPGWGPRDAVSVARIPKGAEVEYFTGTASRQIENGVTFQGNGVQFRFKSFDPSWIIQTRKIPGG